MKRCTLIACMIVTFFPVRLSFAQNWQDYYFGRKGIPYFIVANSQTAIMASDDYIGSYPFDYVSVDAVDPTTGSSINLDKTVKALAYGW